jgi:ATP-dependent Clp protease protease subunit
MIILDEKKREVYIYDMIGPSWLGLDSGDALVEALNKLGPGDVSIRINSPGGDVFEGFAMYNALKRHDGVVTTHNDALVASAATFPFLAGSVRKVAKLSSVMIHEASTFVAGRADDLMKAADLLEKINLQLAELYSEVSGKSVEDILQMMKEETWMDPKQAKEMKFAYEEEKGPEVNNRIVPQGMYKHTPENYLKPAMRLSAVKQRDESDRIRKLKIKSLTGIDFGVE